MWGNDMVAIHHGGNVEKIAEELGAPVDQLLDFSANINPLGFPPEMWNSLVDGMGFIEHYPDVEYTQLRQTIANHFEIETDDVLVSNGGAQMLDEVIRAIHPQESVVMAPSFGEYENFLNRINSTVHHFELEEQDNFHVDIDKLIQFLKDNKQVTAICLANPNNPTGDAVSTDDLEKLVKFCNKQNRYLILDEAFIDLTYPALDTYIDHLSDGDNVVVVHSTTKYFAIPGLRLGYAVVMKDKLKQRILAQQNPWSVNTVAEQFGRQMYTAKRHIQDTTTWLTDQVPALQQELSKIDDIKAFPTKTNYILFKSERTDLRDLLIQFGIIIRQCDDYEGLDAHYYRVAIKTAEQNGLLIEAIKKVLA